MTQRDSCRSEHWPGKYGEELASKSEDKGDQASVLGRGVKMGMG